MANDHSQNDSALLWLPSSPCSVAFRRFPWINIRLRLLLLLRQSVLAGSPADQITKARVSGNRVFVKSLTHEMTPEEGEDSGWEDSDEAIESDEEREDGNQRNSLETNGLCDGTGTSFITCLRRILRSTFALDDQRSA